MASLVVGTILTLLNQGDLLFAGSWDGALYWKMPITYGVPFCVATWGALTNSRIQLSPREIPGARRRDRMPIIPHGLFTLASTS